MKNSHVLTRNFVKKNNQAKYVLADNDGYAEAEIVMLRDVRESFAFRQPIAVKHELEDFGCEIVIAGEKVSSVPVHDKNWIEIVWNGNGFVFRNTATKLYQARFLVADADGIKVLL